LSKHKQQTFCKPQILTEKRSLRKGVTQGFVRWLSVTGLARIKRWAIRSYDTHHRTISTFFSPTTTIAEAEMRAAYLHRTTRPPKCSVRWGRLFCSLGTNDLFFGELTFCSLDKHSVHLELLLFSSGTHLMFIEDTCSVRWERFFSVHWEFMFCSLGTDVLFVGDTP
jgi:hypothetical protein